MMRKRSRSGLVLALCLWSGLASLSGCSGQIGTDEGASADDELRDRRRQGEGFDNHGEPNEPVQPTQPTQPTQPDPPATNPPDEPGTGPAPDPGPSTASECSAAAAPSAAIPTSCNTTELVVAYCQACAGFFRVECEADPAAYGVANAAACGTSVGGFYFGCIINQRCADPL